MKRKQLYLLWILLIVVSGSSCKKFLKDYSQDLAYASSASDLNELLISNSEGSSGYLAAKGGDFAFMNVMDDDITSYMNGDVALAFAGYHYWLKSPSGLVEAPYSDNTWGDLYASIGIANVVLKKVEDFKSDPLYAKVKGEAYYIRANDYLTLMNFYAKPYAKATAATDAGVPLKLTEYVEDKHFTRNTVAEVYSQIVADLKSAADLLKGVKQPSVYRANEMTAHGLLSRVYLYMGEWQLAIDQCDMVLNSGSYALVDLNTQPASSSFITGASSEVIFSEAGNGITTLMNLPDDPSYLQLNIYMPSDELMNLYQPDDLRHDAFFVYATYTPRFVVKKCIPTEAKPVSEQFCVRLGEIYLNKAEAMAMLDKPSDALSALRTLRAKRFKTGTGAIADMQGQALVDFIRTERRMELCFEGQRWNDLRRYAVNEKYPYSKVIKHPVYTFNPATATADQTGYYQLNQYAQDNKAYVLPIPNAEIIFNAGTLVDNPRDTRTEIQ